MLDTYIKPVLDAEKDTLDELLRILKKYFDTKKIITAALFGSVSAQKDTNKSDIDLLLISDDFEYATSSISEAREEVFDVFSNGISSLIFSEKELRTKKNSNLVNSIIANHTMICGKNLVNVIK